MDYDIIIPTWNSARTLRQCLESIRRFADPHKIIIVDRYSTDATNDIATDFGCVTIHDGTSLGSARMKGIEISNTPLVAFIDSDIAIRNGWHDDMTSHVYRTTGAVQGRTILTSSPLREIRMHDATTNLFKKGIRYLQVGDRGFTNTTLIRRKLLSGLNISSFNAWEDYIITQRVLQSGYFWKYVPVFVDHLESTDDWLSKIAWGASGRKEVLNKLGMNLLKQSKITMELLLWYLSQAVKYPLILNDKKILPIFLKAFLLELKGLVREV